MYSIPLKPSLRVTLVMGLVASIIILGCGVINTITTTNPSPASLQTEITIYDGGTDNSNTSPGMSRITVRFRPSSHPSDVLIVQGATISCNNVVLQRKDDSYTGYVPTLTPPSVYTFAYRDHNSKLAIPISALRAVIVTPSNGSSIPGIMTATGAFPVTFPATFRIDGEFKSPDNSDVKITATDENGHIFLSTGYRYYPDNPELNNLRINVGSLTSRQLTLTSQGSYRSSNQQTGFAVTSIYYNFLGQSINVAWQGYMTPNSVG